MKRRICILLAGLLLIMSSFTLVSAATYVSSQSNGCCVDYEKTVISESGFVDGKPEQLYVQRNNIVKEKQEYAVIGSYTHAEKTGCGCLDVDSYKTIGKSVNPDYVKTSVPFGIVFECDY